MSFRAQHRSTTELLLIRHGQSELNAQGRWQGLSDSPLTALGREQARALARELAREPVSAVVSSDLQRAFETARIVADPHGLAPEPEPDLRELDVGAWGERTRAEISARWPDDLAHFDTGHPDARPTGGETRRELEARVLAAAERIAARFPRQCVAVVAHLGVMRVLAPDRDLGNAECCRVSVTELSLRGR